jgi:hypothetical protein
MRLHLPAEARFGNSESRSSSVVGDQDPIGGKRAVSNSTRSASGSNPAIANALLIAASLACAGALLVQKGRLTWPPFQLLSSLSTLAGCLAMVGPLILIRSGEIEGSLGELMWLTGGLLVWFFDVEAVVQGRWNTMTWATPLNDRTLGLAILAVLLAGWKCGLADRNWSWTNVTGWILSAFWVGMAFVSWFLVPAWRSSLAAR